MHSDSKNILNPQGGERVLPYHTIAHLLSPDLHLSLPLPSYKTSCSLKCGYVILLQAAG